MSSQKNAAKILIHLGVRRFDQGKMVEEWDTTSNGGMPIQLDKQLEAYYLRLGNSNAHVLSITIQLLTRGKVRVDFRDQSERLSLLNAGDQMNRVDAVKVFDMWVKAHLAGQELDNTTTQKIMIQPPRVSLPR